jgi:hypothetical protein
MQFIVWDKLVDEPCQAFHMLGQEDLDVKVKLRGVSYAGPPGDLPIAQLY